MAPLAQLPGVAIAGAVYTANHGIERIVVNVTANPAIRFLLLCGKEAALFRPGQSLVALAERGIDPERRIVGAAGYDPVLPTVTPERVAQFRRQVELIDWTGEEELDPLAERIRGLVARSPGRFATQVEDSVQVPEERFAAIRPGGQREPLQYDPKGYFVIMLDRAAEQIVLRHYLPDHTPAHEMQGRTAGPMLLGLLRERLVSQLSHAGYLGEELAKAQAALQLGLRYDQDRPLRPPEEGVSMMPEQQNPQASQAPQQAQETPAPAQAPAAMPSRMPPIEPALTWSQVQATAPGATIDVAVAVMQQPAPDQLVGTLLEPDAAEPFNAFRRTPQLLHIRWTPATKLIMGVAADVQVGALLRARGTLGDDRVFDAQQLVILTHVGRIIE
jgi:tetrahydromethanopterin S-methyltransferase subunit A